MSYIILTPKLSSSEYQEFSIYSLNFFSITFKYTKSILVYFKYTKIHTYKYICSRLTVASSELETKTHFKFNKSTLAWNSLPASSSSLPANADRGYKQQLLDFKQCHLYLSNLCRECIYLDLGTYLNKQGAC